MKNLRFIPTRSIALAGVCVLVALGCETERPRNAATSNATLVTDTVQGTGGKTRPAHEGGGMPEGIARVGSRFYHVRNGEATHLTQSQRFTSGLSYQGGTRVVAGDGSLIRLTDREMLTFGGDRIPLPPGTRLP